MLLADADELDDASLSFLLQPASTHMSATPAAVSLTGVLSGTFMTMSLLLLRVHDLRGLVMDGERAVRHRTRLGGCRITISHVSVNIHKAKTSAEVSAAHR